MRGASLEIDAIETGHTHLVHNCAYPVAAWDSEVKRPVIQTGQYGSNLGQLEITVGRESKQIVEMTGTNLPLVVSGTPAYPADPAVAAIAADAVAVAAEEGAKPVGAITDSILRGQGDPNNRGIESTLGNLVADVQLWATSNEDFGGKPAQIAFMNPGGLRADLQFTGDGTVTYKDVANVQPFGNTLWTMDLTGAQIKTLLEQQWQPFGSSRPYLHLGVSQGFEYTTDATNGRGNRVLEMTLHGEVIKPSDVFRVAVNSFLASGGDNFTVLAQGTNASDTGQNDLIATVGYFAAKKSVTPAELGRAVSQTPAPEAFSDVSADAPFAAEIAWVSAAQIASGYADGTFRATDMVTRQEMAAFLYRAAGSPAFTAPEVSPFIDVATDHPFYLEISWLSKVGITSTSDSGLFRPADSVSRQAMATFLQRANQL